MSIKNKKSNILFFSPQRCNGCTLCEMACSLLHTHGECDKTKSSIKVITHPYLYSSVISVSMNCNCPDGKEKCVEICNRDAIIFVTKDQSPGMLKKEDWIASPIIS